jgi:hypothetical protein
MVLWRWNFFKRHKKAEPEDKEDVSARKIWFFFLAVVT